jgi:group I intron endonuclease
MNGSKSNILGMGYIYKVVNKLNGMMYIGQTKNDLYERWRGHKKITSNCLYLKNALQKYGVENFSFKLICICFDEDLDFYEVEYIQKHNTIVPNGYNIRDGGNSGKHNEITKLKISNSLKNRTKNITNRRVGIPHTLSTKERISKALKGRVMKKETIQKLSKLNTKHNILQYDSQNKEISTYPNIIECAKSLGVSKAAVSMVCTGKRKSLKGYLFKYIDKK